MTPKLRTLAVALFAAPSLALAQPGGPPPGGPPMGPPPAASHDPAAAPAGLYQVDTRHVAVVARVSHMGFSYSVFRFGTVSGTLDWNPARVEASRLDVNVAPGSIETNVPGFAKELAGPRFLNAQAYPDAHFVSTAVRVTGPDTGLIEGRLTLMGVTRPERIEARLVGAGAGMRGRPTIGFSGKMAIAPADFGLTSLPPATPPIELDLDLQFDRAAGG